MHNLRPFQFKGILIKSPDDISEALDLILNKDDGRIFIISLANRLTYGDTTNKHIHHACFLVLKIGEGRNFYVTEAVQSVW